MIYGDKSKSRFCKKMKQNSTLINSVSEKKPSNDEIVVLKKC